MIHGYPQQPSVRPGGTLILHVSTTARWFRVDFYRQGTHPIFISTAGWLRGSAAPDGPPHEDWRWPAYRFRIPTDWRSGAYVAMLTEGDRKKTPVASPDVDSPDARSMKALFVVLSRNPGVTASILYKLPLTTYHAYNYAGGGSLYQNHRVSLIPFGSKVTMRRPGGGTGGPLPPSHHDFIDVYDTSSPRQSFAHWEAPFIGWLEANGYAVDYCTDLEVHADVDASAPLPSLCERGSR